MSAKPNRNWHNPKDLDRAISQIVGAVRTGTNRHVDLVMAGFGSVNAVESADAIRWALREGRIFDIGGGCYSVEEWAALENATCRQNALNASLSHPPSNESPKLPKDAGRPVSFDALAAVEKTETEIRVLCLHCRKETNGAECDANHYVNFIEPEIGDPEEIPETPAEQLRRQIAQMRASKDPAVRESARMLSECSGDREWLEAIDEPSPPAEEIDSRALVFDGLKLVNSKTAEAKGYWLLIGNEADVNAACAELADMGIFDFNVKRNGSKGTKRTHRLYLGFWVQMSLFDGSRLKRKSGELLEGSLQDCVYTALAMAQIGVQARVIMTESGAEIHLGEI